LEISERFIRKHPCKARRCVGATGNELFERKKNWQPKEKEREKTP